MIEINFYSEWLTTWEELQKMALDVLKDYEEDIDDEEAEASGDLPDSLVNADYKRVLELGLKTFIFDVLNEWGKMNLLLIDGKFYKKNNTVELESIFRNLDKNLFKTQTELFNQFKSEGVKLSTDEYDLIMDNFESGVLTMVYSYDLKIINIDGDDDEEDDEY